MFGTPSNWFGRRQAMPVDHRLLRQAVVEEDVELVAGIEGEARLAVGAHEAIDLGRAAIHVDAAAVDGQGSGRCGAG